MYNSTLYDNFSVKASIAFVENQATLQIFNSLITRNRAVSTGGVIIVDSTETSVFSNVTIQQNYLVNSSSIIEEIESESI